MPKLKYCLLFGCLWIGAVAFSQQAKVQTEIELKEVTVKKRKRTPSYLMRVDTIRQQKSAFYILLAKEAFDRDRYKDAHGYIEKAIELNPANYEAHRLLADLLAVLREYEKAVAEYGICNEMAGDSAAVWYNMGQMQLQLFKPREAMKCFNRALELDRSFSLAYMARASLNMEKANYKAALPDLDVVLNMNPMFYNGNKTRGIARLHVRDFSGAVEDLDVYLAYDSTDAHSYVQRGLAFIGAGNLVKGCMDFNRAVQLGHKEATKALKEHCR